MIIWNGLKMTHAETHKSCSQCAWMFCSICQPQCPNCGSPHYNKAYHDAYDCNQTLDFHNKEHPDAKVIPKGHD